MRSYHNILSSSLFLMYDTGITNWFWILHTFFCVKQVILHLTLLVSARKRPILIFTGDHDGSIVKWEQMQSNNFMYSNESFHVTELMLKKMTKVRILTLLMYLLLLSITQQLSKSNC